MAMEAELASAPVAGRMRASLAGEWHRAGPAQRFACLAGGALILAGMAVGPPRNSRRAGRADFAFRRQPGLAPQARTPPSSHGGGTSAVSSACPTPSAPTATRSISPYRYPLH